jgi:predicted deacylase
MPPETTEPKSRSGIIGIIIVIIILGIGGLLVARALKESPVPPVEEPVAVGPVHSVIGTSVKGRAIDAYTYGSGPTQLLFVGGIHGGYEWNSVLLAYTFMEYLDTNPTVLPPDLTVTVIPSANPDGVFAVVGKEGRFTSADVSTSTLVQESGRFNAHGVDLNRNFDCKWKPKSTWRSKEVSAGTKAFSEPETQALRNVIASTTPRAVIFWHSQSNAVYASQCEKGILPETLALMNTYALAAGYPAVKSFDAYVTTGAADDWLASQNIPAITVELKTHETIEWDKNLAGIKALFKRFSTTPATSTAPTVQ